jgi:uncharacterized membrane protein
MIEIIPNWHPIFVHFTVALLSLATALFLVSSVVKPPLQEQWRIVARWALWFGAGFAVVTGLTGLYAYNTVAHDTPSHAAMTEHRNLAIVTIALFVALAIWSALRVRRNQVLGAVFITAVVIAGGVLVSTAWHGGELVYRYGLGVMSLPKAEGEGHTHEHADGEGHEHENDHGGGIPADSTMGGTSTDMQEHGHETHDHDAHDHDAHDHDTGHAHDEEPTANTGLETSTDSSTSQQSDHHHDDGHDHNH